MEGLKKPSDYEDYSGFKFEGECYHFPEERLDVIVSSREVHIVSYHDDIVHTRKLSLVGKDISVADWWGWGY